MTHSVFADQARDERQARPRCVERRRPAISDLAQNRGLSPERR